jgi:4-amino-4-deoxychorismate lyase
MILINGKQCETIQVLDRGFQYGDGAFETIEIQNKHPVFLELHLIRLNKACIQLKIPFPDIKLLREEVFFISTNSAGSAVLKLMLTRGLGGRGYRQPKTISTSRVLSLHVFPEFPEDYKTNGIKARFCCHQLGLNPALAGIKHLNRLDQVMARSEWDDDSIQEGLMLNCKQHVIEGTMSNLFVVKKGGLFTPILDQCGVSGIIRNQILCIANDCGIPMQETQMSSPDIMAADELFVTNSIIGIWPVKQLEQQQYKVGPLTRQLNSLLSQRKQQDLSLYD